MLILATFGLAADLANVPSIVLEALLAGVIVVTVERVIATVIALEAVIAVRTAEIQAEPPIVDP